MSRPFYYHQQQSGPSYAPPNVYCPRVPPRSHRPRQAVHDWRTEHYYPHARPPSNLDGPAPDSGNLQYRNSYPPYGTCYSTDPTTYAPASTYGIGNNYHAPSFDSYQSYEQYAVGYYGVSDADSTSQLYAVPRSNCESHQPSGMRYDDGFKERAIPDGGGYLPETVPSTEFSFASCDKASIGRESEGTHRHRTSRHHGREHSRHRGHDERRERHRGSDGGYRDHGRRRQSRSSHHRRRRSRSDRSPSPTHSRSHHGRRDARSRRDERKERYGSRRPSSRVDAHRRRYESTERREQHTDSTRHLSRRGEDLIKELVDLPDVSIERVVTYVTDKHGNEYRLQVDHRKAPGIIPSASTSASSSKVCSPTTPSFRLQTARVIEEPDTSGYEETYAEPCDLIVEPPDTYAGPRIVCNRYSPEAQEIIAAIESRRRWQEDAAIPHHHAVPSSSVTDLPMPTKQSLYDAEAPTFKNYYEGRDVYSSPTLYETLEKATPKEEEIAAPVVVRASDDNGRAKAGVRWPRKLSCDEESFGHISSLYDEAASEVDPAEKERKLDELEAIVLDFTSAISGGEAFTVDSKPSPEVVESNSVSVGGGCSGENRSPIVEEATCTEAAAAERQNPTELDDPRCSALSSVNEDMTSPSAKDLMEPENPTELLEAGWSGEKISTVMETATSPSTNATEGRENTASDKKVVIAQAAVQRTSASEHAASQMTKEAVTKELLLNKDAKGSDSVFFNSSEGSSDSSSDRDGRDRGASCTVSEDYFTAPSLADSDDLVALNESVNQRLNRLLVLNDPSARLGAPMHNRGRRMGNSVGQGGGKNHRRRKNRR